LPGVKEPIEGTGAMTEKSVLLSAIPAGASTRMAPELEPVSTTKLISVGESTVNERAGVPLTETPIVPPRFSPVSLTVVPGTPLAGLNAVMAGLMSGGGAGVTVNSAGAMPEPPSVVVTTTAPVLAPFGTTASSPAGSCWKIASLPAKVTVVTPTKLVPVIRTWAPAGPFVGVTAEISGAAGTGPAAVTWKNARLASPPPAVATLTGPVKAPTGTMAVTDVGAAVKDSAGTPPK
jgi:hypothetical protein